MLARTCQNIGQMMQQPKLNSTTAINGDIDHNGTLNPALSYRNKNGQSLSNLSNNSVNFMPDSNNVTGASYTAHMTNSGNSIAHNNNNTETRNYRIDKNCKLPDNKPTMDVYATEGNHHRGKRNPAFKVKRPRLEQPRHPQLSATKSLSPPSPKRHVMQEQINVASRAPPPSTTQSIGQRLSTSISSYIPQAHPMTNSSSAKHRHPSSSSAGEYLSDCVGGENSSSNALAQLARLSSRLPLPDPPRLSANHSQPEVNQKLGNSNWFDPLRVQTGMKRPRQGVHHKQNTTISNCGNDTGMGGVIKASPVRYPMTSSIPSPSSHYDIPLRLSNRLTSPSLTHNNSSNYYTGPSNHTPENCSPTASSSGLSPPTSNIHSQWLGLLNALQYMGAGQHQASGLTHAGAKQPDLISYQMAHSFLDFFYGRMQNGDLDSFPNNQHTGSPSAMELATAAFIAATSTTPNHQVKDYKAINGESRSSPNHNQSSSSTSSSPTSFGNNPLLSAGLPTPPQPHDLLPHGQKPPLAVPVQQCSICGHSCSDLHEFYTHVYAHLTANIHMPPQQHAKPTAPATFVWDSLASPLSCPRMRQFPSGIGSPYAFPGHSGEHAHGSGNNRESLCKMFLGDGPAAPPSTSNAWSNNNFMRWLASYYTGSASVAAENELNSNYMEASKRQSLNGLPPTVPMLGIATNHSPFSRLDIGSLNFPQASDSNDPRSMWMRLFAEHARSTQLSPTVNSTNMPAGTTPARSNPTLTPWNMANAYLALFPQV